MRLPRPTRPAIRAARPTTLAVLTLATLLTLAGCGSEEDIRLVLDVIAIDASGGTANQQTGAGGDAGPIEATLFHGGAGTIEVRTTGAADASFTPSAGVVVDLGANPLVVSTSLAIGVAVVEPSLGTPYAIVGDTALRISDGNGVLGDETPVSGLEIEPGATLTLPITNTTVQAAELDFTHDVVNDGVLTVADVDATLRGSIDIVAGGSYHGTGPVQTHGTVPGQSGGYISLFLEGAGYNSGPFTTWGADRVGGNGGDGGEIVFRTDWATQGEQIENTGRMDTHGGRASNGSGIGGDGGDISILPYLHLWSSGDLISSGGDGVQGGGRAGSVRIAGDYRGELRNGGHVTANGGHTASGAAGGGGGIELEAWGGDLVSSGTLSARGGNSTGSSGVGGAGGAITLYVTSSDDDWEPMPLNVPAGDLYASGAMDASGGTATGPGGQGGAGGAIQLQIENDVSMGMQSIHLHGYGLLDARAGNGYMAGSSAGASFDVAGASGMRTGPIIVDASVDTSGGDANPGLAGSTGGDAGDLVLRSSTFSYERVTLPGGTGATPGANGAVIAGP